MIKRERCPICCKEILPHEDVVLITAKFVNNTLPHHLKCVAPVWKRMIKEGHIKRKGEQEQ